MKRIAASLVLALGLMFSVVVGGASLASAQTPGHSRVCLTTNSGGTKKCGETSPGAGSGLKHMKPTSTPGHGSNAQTHTPAVTPSQPAVNSLAMTTPASSLAFTGADVTGTVILGLLLIGGGLMLVRVTRRRTLV